MTVRQDLTIRQGATWTFTFTKTSGGSPVDLTGYAARMAIRRTVGATLEAYLSSEADANGGSLALGGAAGTITASMTAAQSAALGSETWSALVPQTISPEDTYRYDLELVSPAGVVTRELEGRVLLYREVTT